MDNAFLLIDVSLGTIRGKSYEKNKDFEFMGFTFNR